MLSTLGTRTLRPAGQVIRRAVTSRRYSSYQPARAQQRGYDLARRSNDEQGRLAGRPLGLLSNTFFPDQVGSVFRDIEDELARVWGGNGQSQTAQKSLGAVDIKETKDQFSFVLDTPGLSKKDVSVRVTPDNVLVISGERAAEDKKEEDGWYRVERSFGKFQRRFGLPDNVDTSGIKAEVKNGELVVNVPKKESAKKELTDIPVEDGSTESSNGDQAA